MPNAASVLFVRHVRNELIRTGTRLSSAAPALILVALIFGSCATYEPTVQTRPAEGLVRLTSITVDSNPNGSFVRIFTSRKVEFSSYLLTDPPRIAVEIPNVSPELDLGRRKVESGLVSSVNVAVSPKSNSVRLEFELASEAKFNFSQTAGYLELRIGAASNPAPRALTNGGKNDAPTAADLAAENERLKRENLELKKQVYESSEQLGEANKLSQILKSRMEFIEKQLDELEEKIRDNERVRQDAPLKLLR